jgi:hypothetical protein
MVDLPGLPARLTTGGVRFIIVGGVAAVAHGSARLTAELDIVYERSHDNLERLSEALAPYSPYPRGAPPGLPFQWDISRPYAAVSTSY